MDSVLDVTSFLVLMVTYMVGIVGSTSSRESRITLNSFFVPAVSLLNALILAGMAIAGVGMAGRVCRRQCGVNRNGTVLASRHKNLGHCP